jgi:hypothetical protein
MSVTKADRERIESLDMPELARAILAHLQGWTLELPEEDDRRHWVYLRHTGGARVCLHRSSWPVEVSASAARWPRIGGLENQGEEFAPRERMRMAFSPLRDPKTLARDIERRLLSSYLPEYARQVEARDKAQRQADTSHQLALVLADIFGVELRDYSEGWRLYASGGPAYEIRIARFGTVYFERLNLNKPDRILELSRLFASWAKADKAPESEPACLGCFRPESECSAEPCAAVVADREATL